jgi:hypothetical protein
MSKPPPSTDAEAVQRAARAAARRLTAEYGAQIEADVEHALHTGNAGESVPDQYFDPISLGALIVGAATLAWTVYRDLRKQSRTPAPDVLSRRVRLELVVGQQLSKRDRDRVIDLVVEEIIANPDS